MNRILAKTLVSIFALFILMGANCSTDDSDTKQQEAQELILSEGASRTGMPAISSFYEKKLVKQLYELRDQANLSTVTYLVAEQTGQLVYLCDSIGYGIPAAMQFTNPQKVGRFRDQPYVLPQADPNGLFSPASAEGTWVFCKDPGGTVVKPVYTEPRIIVSQFELRKSSEPPIPPERLPAVKR